MQSWLPSVSVIRWIVQAMTINEFSDETNFTSLPRLSYYDATMTVFGLVFNQFVIFAPLKMIRLNLCINSILNINRWGGKTKQECILNSLYSVCLFGVLVFIVMCLRSRQARGDRCFRKSENNEFRLY